MIRSQHLTAKPHARQIKTMVILGTSILAVAVVGASAATILTTSVATSRGSASVKTAVASVSTLLLTGSSPSAAVRPVAPAPVAAPAPAPAPAAGSALGINLTLPTYYGGERAFMNLAAGSGWTLSGPGIPYGEMPANRLDVNGVVTKLNPGETATRILSLPNAAYKGQSVKIKCTWAGAGSLRMAGWIASNTSYSANSLTFTWVPSGKQNANIWMTSTNVANPIRQLDCREADASPTEVFHPDYIKSLAPYSMIRFMDWANTNANKAVTWATRTTPQSSLTIGTDGVAVEHMVKLANSANVDPWFSMPWNADATYIRNFATYVRDNLSANRKVYVETSNEVWNYQFPVAIQALNEGRKKALNPQDLLTHLSRYAEKSTEVMKIWTEVFAAQPQRLVRIVSTQNAVNWTSEFVLGYKDTAKYVDALATAPYFGYDIFNGANASLTNLDTIFSILPKKVDEAIASAKANKANAAKFGKRYIAYESGQHIITTNVGLNQSIQRDPRMAQMYDLYLNAWKQQIGDRLTLFADVGPISKYGAWGMQEYVGQPVAEAPKLRSVLKFAGK